MTKYTFSDVFLHKFWAADPDKSTLCVVRHCSGQQSLASSRWPVQEHSFRLLDTQRFKQLGMFHWEFYHLEKVARSQTQCISLDAGAR